MLYFNQLTKVSEGLDEFLIKAMNHNMAFFTSAENKATSYDSQFYSAMEHLSRFGSKMTGDYVNIELYYKVDEKSKIFPKLKFYAIDQTGLIHGSIEAPISTIAKYKNYETTNYHYYGRFGEKRDCVAKLESSTIDLNSLRNDFLPLPLIKAPSLIKKEDHPILKRDVYTFDHYFDVDYSPYTAKSKFFILDLDSRRQNPIIYRTFEKSFYLPFRELLISNLELGLYQNVWVLPKFIEHRKKIYFKAYHKYRTRKYEHIDTYDGSISYDKFEIIEIQKTEASKDMYW